MKGVFILFRIFRIWLISIVLLSCATDEEGEEPTPVPTPQDIEGYWQLSKLLRLGQPIPFNEYPGFMSFVNLNTRYLRDANGTYQYQWVVEQATMATIANGPLVLDGDIFSIGLTRHKIKAFNPSSITLINLSLPAYELIFSRSQSANYPEILVAAVIDGIPLSSEGSLARKENSRLVVSGSLDKKTIFFFLDEPSRLVAGGSYPIVNGMVLYLSDSRQDFGRVVNGQFSVNRITDNYIDVDFDVILQSNNNDGQRITISNGKIKTFIFR